MSKVDLKRWHNNLQQTDHSKHKHAKNMQKTKTKKQDVSVLTVQNLMKYWMTVAQITAQ